MRDYASASVPIRREVQAQQGFEADLVAQALNTAAP